jgi:membrane associated rhomboid family serine protease
MTEPEQMPGSQGRPPREPIFLLPNSVTALVGILVAIHLAATMVLNEAGQTQLYFWFAFQPLRIVLAPQDITVAIPLLWTPFSHAFLHGGWDHLLVNVAWLVIFASPVARRYGAGPMLAIFLVSAAAGAAFFAVTSLYTGAYLIGASGGIAGLTALREVFINPRSRFFTLIWLVLNAAVPLAPLLMGASLGVAWQAHLGGFFAGLLMVGLFERKPQ